MPKKTPLHAMHLLQNALMVDFGGWHMPLHYGSQIEEHHYVRKEAGMFDVSHMGVVDIQGEAVQTFLRYLLANDIDKLKTPGKALYTCMLSEAGCILDDLIVYYISPTYYRLVINAGTTEKDIQWIQSVARQYSLQISLKTDLAMIAIQGPLAFEKITRAFPSLKQDIQNLKPFHAFQQQNRFVARTGYTGEEGLEIILPALQAETFWQTLLDHGVKPIGLGARDTLRLEAGLNLYGQDMDESVTPFEANLDWTIALLPETRHFIGREALEVQKRDGVSRKLMGIILLDKGVLRHHQDVYIDTEKVGEITSGTFSPTLKKAIGFARVQGKILDNDEVSVEIRGKHLKAKIVKTPFVKKGKCNDQ